MTFRQLIAIADKAISPDQPCLLLYLNDKDEVIAPGQDLEKNDGRLHRFLVEELARTFVLNSSDTSQVGEAYQTMHIVLSGAAVARDAFADYEPDI